MKLSFSHDRVLAVVAHPDDAELLCAGTLARAKDDGAAIGVCVLCRGDKGQPAEPLENLVETRRRESQAAMQLLGAELFPGEAADGALADQPEQRLRLVETFRRFRPTLVLAHAAGDYHPDHQAASALGLAASWFCASRGQVTDSPALDQAPALWWLDCVNGSEFEPHFFVDVSDYAELKLRMLACHQSQIQRGDDRDFAPLEELLRRQQSFRGGQAGVAAAEAFRASQVFKRARAW